MGGHRRRDSLWLPRALRRHGDRASPPPLAETHIDGEGSLEGRCPPSLGGRRPSRLNRSAGAPRLLPPDPRPPAQRQSAPVPARRGQFCAGARLRLPSTLFRRTPLALRSKADAYQRRAVSIGPKGRRAEVDPTREVRTTPPIDAKVVSCGMSRAGRPAGPGRRLRACIGDMTCASGSPTRNVPPRAGPLREWGGLSQDCAYGPSERRLVWPGRRCVGRLRGATPGPAPQSPQGGQGTVPARPAETKCEADITTWLNRRRFRFSRSNGCVWHRERSPRDVGGSTSSSRPTPDPPRPVAELVRQLRGRARPFLVLGDGHPRGGARARPLRRLPPAAPSGGVAGRRRVLRSRSLVPLVVGGRSRSCHGTGHPRRRLRGEAVGVDLTHRSEHASATAALGNHHARHDRDQVPCGAQDSSLSPPSN